MKNFSISLVLTLLFYNPLFCHAAAKSLPEKWTPEKAVSFALQNNPDIQIAATRINSARAAEKLALSPFYPTIQLSAGYSQTDNPLYSFGNYLNQEAFSNDIDFNDPGRTDDLQIKATLKYNFFNGGKDKAEKDKAHAQLAMQQTRLSLLHHQLSFETVRAYYRVEQAENQKKIRTNTLTAIHQSLQVARARYEAGDLLKQDVLNLELQKERAGENLIIAGHSLALAQTSFLTLLGLSEQSVILDYEHSFTTAVPEISGYANRLELTLLEFEKKAAQAELKKIRGSYLPTLDSYGSYQFDKGFETEEEGDSWMAGIALNYSLYEGNSTGARIEQCVQKIKELEAADIKLSLDLAMDLEQAELGLDQAQKRLEVTKKMVTLAQETARLARARFKGGNLLAAELIDIEIRLTDALARLSCAQSEYKIAIANLKRAAGKKQFI